MDGIVKLGQICRNNKKELIINIAGIFLLTALVFMCSTFSYQPQIAKEVLRFHVIANSDSEEDQALKLKVKEAVLEEMREKLADAGTVEQAEQIISSNLEQIEAVADAVIFKEGYSYKSKGVLGKTTFPVKQYGDMVFPAGEYEAFRLLIGEAQGKNWWCVMFPTLCYVDEAYDVITEENKEKFREILTEEEYESLLAGQKTQVFYKLKSAGWLNKVIDYFRK